MIQFLLVLVVAVHGVTNYMAVRNEYIKYSYLDPTILHSAAPCDNYTKSELRRVHIRVMFSKRMEQPNTLISK